MTPLKSSAMVFLPPIDFVSGVNIRSFCGGGCRIRSGVGDGIGGRWVRDGKGPDWINQSGPLICNAVGAAGFEPTTTSSRTTPPADLRRVAMLETIERGKPQGSPPTPIDPCVM